MPSNQEIEAAIFDEFKRQCLDNKVANVEQPNPPAPDILFDHGGKAIGLEITRHLRPTLKKHESEVDEIVAEAQKIYKSRGLPNVGVGVSWVPHSPLQRSDRGPLALAVAEVVASNLPAPDTAEFLEWRHMPEKLKTRIHHLRVCNPTSYSEDLWSASGGGTYPDVSPEDIEQYIQTKEKGFAAYSQFGQETWLLIAAYGSGPSSWCELPTKTLESRFQTKFDRVFFMAPVTAKVVELKLQKPLGRT